MVKVPVVTTLDTPLPEMVPIRALEATAASAGPPVTRPVAVSARFTKNWPAPLFSRNAPKRMNIKINVALTLIAEPKTPSVPRYRNEIRRLNVKAWWLSAPGMR